MLYISGQLGIIKGTKDFVSPDVGPQTEAALKHMGAILEAAGCSYTSVVKTTILLSDMADFAKVRYNPLSDFSKATPAS